MRIPARRTPTTYQVSDACKGQIVALGTALNMTRSDVLALAVAELAARNGLPDAAEDQGQRRPARPAQLRAITDPPGPIPTKHNAH